MGTGLQLSKIPTTERAALLPTLTLFAGSHEPNGKACAMELTAWLAGEPWSDHPECTCPVIGAFVRNWNDNLPDNERTTLLLPLLPKLIGTRGSSALANRRAVMATDWLIRVNTPAWLRLAGLTTHADALASLPEITDFAKTPSLMPVLEAARKDAAAAWDAAWAAAWDAARDAAWDAARDAAWDAAGAAAGDAAWAAARDAAWDAAWDAARDAAWDAAWAAAGAAAWAAAGDAACQTLEATKTELQQSAVALVERMCAATDLAVAA